MSLSPQAADPPILWITRHSAANVTFSLFRVQTDISRIGSAVAAIHPSEHAIFPAILQPSGPGRVMALDTTKVRLSQTQ